MGRFTNSDAETRHVLSVANKLYAVAPQGGWRVKLVLKDGSVVTGHFTNLNMANNEGAGGVWRVQADVIVAGESGTTVVDLLDVAQVVAP